MPGPIFASGAVLNADGTITPVVDANSPRFTAVTEAPEPTAPQPAAEPAAGDEDETPVPVEPTAPGDGDAEPVEVAESAEPAEGAQPTSEEGGQRPGESNRGFRARLWDENQNYRRRHAELLARDSEREQRLAFLEGQLAALSRAPATPQEVAAPKPGSAGAPGLGVRARPQPQQYGDYQLYEDDLLNWRDEVRAAERVAREQAEAQSHVELQWRQRTEEGRLHYPDYDARMATLQVATGPGSVLAPFFIGSEHGAALMYHLGTHAEELRAFNGMTPDAAARYLVGLEARFMREQKHGESRSSRPAASAAPPAPPAPAPLAPVGTGSAQPVVGFHAGMALSDYEQMRLKERNGRP